MKTVVKSKVQNNYLQFNLWHIKNIVMLKLKQHKKKLKQIIIKYFATVGFAD